MATSGSYDHNATGVEIITESLELIGVYDPADSIRAADIKSCLQTLNLMVKHWQPDIGLWKMKNAVLFPEYEEYEYLIGPSGDHASASYVKTEVATAADSGDSTVTVDDDTGVTDGDAIGVELDDGTLQWTTVNGVPAADVITITAALTDDVAVDNHVYTYTDILQRPTEITEARFRNEDGNERPISIVSRDEYMALSNKDDIGSINQVYYEPLLTNGKLYVWQACSDVKEVIKFTAKIPFEDFDSQTNDPDFPQEWLLPLAWNLAVLVAPKFERVLKPTFVARADYLKQVASNFDIEQSSSFLRIKSR